MPITRVRTRMPTTRPQHRACRHALTGRTILIILIALAGTASCTPTSGARPTPSHQHMSSTSPSPGPSSPAPTTPASPTTGAEDGVGPTASQTPAATALTVADGFARNWIRGDLPQPQWWNGVAPYCDAHLASRLRTTDPGRVPASTLIEPPFAHTATPVSATFQWSTNNGVLIVTCNLLNGRWQVTEVDFSLEDDQ
jgi:hypothetical protein